ncbi:MAG TPA: hypothetical protein VIF62_23610 [Labilithrix sp.]
MATLPPLLKKLRYKPGMRVYVANAPVAYESQLGRVAGDIERAKKLSGRIDLIHAFYTRKSAVEKDAKKLAAALAPGGLLWLSYPKGKQLASDLNRDVLREAVAPFGLEAVALVALDDVWSALRCKIVEP